LPQWLLDHLEIRETEVSPTHSRPDGTVVSTRLHTLDGLREGRVCSRCNNGWMSQLEVRAKPILTSLFDDGRNLTQLSAEERAIIARWAAKTVYVLNSASNYHKNIPEYHFSVIRTGEPSIPAGVLVLGHQHQQSQPFFWAQHPAWLIYPGANIRESNVQEATEGSYKTSLQFGRLFLLVAYVPKAKVQFLLWRRVHALIWQESTDFAWYERQGFSKADINQALVEFHMGLMLRDYSPRSN
jgi:hypothetical protein